MYDESFIEYLQSEKRFSSLTVGAYRRDMKQFATYMTVAYAIDDLTKVDATMVKSYIVTLKEEGMVNRSINRKISTLRTYYKYLLREDKVEKSPMVGIKALKTPKSLVKFVT